MSPAISPADDPGEIADAQIPDVAASGYRERAIREYLLSLGGTDGLSVSCIPKLSTACIEQDSREEAPTIRIPARDFSQRTHNYSQEVANRLIQYGLALHEHGHDRYTAGPFLKEIFNRAEFSQPYSDLYWDCINGIEDYRIEKALIEAEGKWAEERLTFTHQNFTYVPPEQTPDPENVTWATAIHSATIHYGKAQETFDFQPILEDESDQSLQWRSSRDKQIYYAVLPELKQTLEAVSSEPNGKAAAREMMAFVHTFDKFLDQLSDDPPEREQEQEDSVDNSRDDKQNDMGAEKESADSLEQSDEGEEQDGSDDSSDTSAGPSESSTSGSESEQEDGQEEEETTQEQAENTEEKEAESPDSGEQSEGEQKTESENGGNSDVGGQQEQQDSANTGKPESEATSSEEPGYDSGEKKESPNADQQSVEASQDSGGDDEEDTDEAAGDGSEEVTESDSGEATESDSSDRSDNRGDNEAENNHSPGEEEREHAQPQQEQESDRDGGEGPSEHQPEGPEGTSRESEQQPCQEPEQALVEREAQKASHEERKLERDKQKLEREIERLQAAMTGGDGEVDRLEMVDPSDESGNTETWDDIRTESQILKGPLQQSLQQTQTTDERRGTHTGSFEPSLSHRLSVSNLAINKQTTEGQKKSYSVVLVLDRSGSMAQQISTAEVAVGGFAVALEQLGVNVAIVDLYRSNARMVKPFGTPTRQVRNNLTSGRTGGGTPLADALVVSRERVRQEPHFPFMFVVSDGKPHDKERYLSALEETHFPVVGVTLTQSSSADEFDEYYDICRSASADEIGDELISLATEIMF